MEYFQSKIQIFRVKPNSNHVCWYHPVIEDYSKHTTFFKGESIQKCWDNTLIWDDISGIDDKISLDFAIGITGGFIISQKVYDSALHSFFASSGELLPIHIGLTKSKFYAFNITRIIDLLDQDKLEWEYYKGTDIKRKILNYPINLKRIDTGTTFFKIPETIKIESLLTVSSKDIGSNFIENYKLLGFKGLLFEQIYPPTDIPQPKLSTYSF